MMVAGDLNLSPGPFLQSHRRELQFPSCMVEHSEARGSRTCTSEIPI